MALESEVDRLKRKLEEQIHGKVSYVLPFVADGRDPWTDKGPVPPPNASALRTLAVGDSQQDADSETDTDTDESPSPVSPEQAMPHMVSSEGHVSSTEMHGALKPVEVRRSHRTSRARHGGGMPLPEVLVSYPVAMWVCERYRNFFASKPPGLLQRDLYNYWDRTASLSSALFTSMPLTVAMSKSVWQFLLFIIGVIPLAGFVYWCVQVSQNGTRAVRQGRFIAANLDGVQDVAFGYSGFPLTTNQWTHAVRHKDEFQIAVSFPEVLRLNEVWILADAGARGPPSYRVEFRSHYFEINEKALYSGPAWETWLCCGSGENGCSNSDQELLLDEGRAGCSFSDQFKENDFNERFVVRTIGPAKNQTRWYGRSFSASANWNHHFKVMTQLLTGAGFVMSPALFGAIGWHRATKRSGAFFATLLAVFEVITLAIGFYDDYQVWALFFISTITAFTIIFKQRHIFRVFFGSFGLYFLVLGFHALSESENSFGTMMALVGAFFLGALLAVEISKHRTVMKAQTLISEDVKTYQALWEEMCRNPKVVDTLNALVVGCTPEKHWKKEVRQLDHQDRPLLDLGQIFAQAWAVNQVLGEKVATWARKAGAKKPPHVKLKSVDRAIQKVHRSYAGDPSRLLDICRRAIILESIEGMTRCVKEIREDHQIEVLRIKNRMAPGSVVDTGYRDVNISLRVRTDDTRALGSELHVCEVQLILLDFWERKTAKGHKAYVEFRNLTGT